MLGLIHSLFVYERKCIIPKMKVASLCKLNYQKEIIKNILIPLHVSVLNLSYSKYLLKICFRFAAVDDADFNDNRRSDNRSTEKPKQPYLREQGTHSVFNIYLIFTIGYKSGICLKKMVSKSNCIPNFLCISIYHERGR